MEIRGNKKLDLSILKQSYIHIAKHRREMSGKHTEMEVKVEGLNIETLPP